MSYTIEYLTASRVVRTVTKGKMDLADYTQQTEEVVKFAREQGTGLFLSDIRQVVNHATIGDILRINALYDALLQSRANRLALLVKKDQKDYSLIKIFEMSCTVRGWNVRCFLDEQEAIHWLTA